MIIPNNLSAIMNVCQILKVFGMSCLHLININIDLYLLKIKSYHYLNNNYLYKYLISQTRGYFTNTIGKTVVIPLDVVLVY